MTDSVASDQDATGVERVFREVYGQAVATLTRILGDITLAEDAVQDAFVVATDRWREEGIPPNPVGWIITTARNRAIDGLRRSARGAELYEQIAATQSPMGELGADYESEEEPVIDDQLRMMFTCCHPSLRSEHQVALTLQLLGGLTRNEVATAFLVSEAAMAKRLVRAKYKIRAAGIPYRVPEASELPMRLRSVLSVLYLIYNAGANDLDRSLLRGEALRLARILVNVMPEEPEAAGLLALMLLNESRMDARMVRGDIVLLKDQDRGLWDQAMIDEGQAIVRSCIRRAQPGPFQIQAAIQAVHCDALSSELTDWHQIVVLYDDLYEMAPTPVIALNRAIATGETEGPEAAIAALDTIGTELDGYYLMHATRATMLRRLGDRQAAIEAFRRASSIVTTEADRRFLALQIEELMSERKAR